jgi:hypothetical protein
MGMDRHFFKVPGTYSNRHGYTQEKEIGTERNGRVVLKTIESITNGNPHSKRECHSHDTNGQTLAHISFDQLDIDFQTDLKQEEYKANGSNQIKVGQRGSWKNSVHVVWNVAHDGGAKNDTSQNCIGGINEQWGGGIFAC